MVISALSSPIPLIVRPYRDADWPEWLRMSHALFPTETDDSLTSGMRDFRARSDAEVFVEDYFRSAILSKRGFP